MWVFFFLSATLLSGYAHKSFLPFWNGSPILEGQLCTPPPPAHLTIFKGLCVGKPVFLEIDQKFSGHWPGMLRRGP